MIYLCLSVVLIATLPLHECRAKREQPFDLEFLSEVVNKLSADVNILSNNPQELTPTTTINAVEQIRTIAKSLEAMKKAIMNKVDASEVDLDAQIQIKVLQMTLNQTAEKLKELIELNGVKKTGKLPEIVKGVGNWIKGAAKTFGKVARNIKETVGHGVKTATGVATSVYNSLATTGSDVYNTLSSAIMEESEK